MPPSLHHFRKHVYILSEVALLLILGWNTLTDPAQNWIDTRKDKQVEAYGAAVAQGKIVRDEDLSLALRAAGCPGEPLEKIYQVPDRTWYECDSLNGNRDGSEGLGLGAEAMPRFEHDSATLGVGEKRGFKTNGTELQSDEGYGTGGDTVDDDEEETTKWNFGIEEEDEEERWKCWKHYHWQARTDIRIQYCYSRDAT